MKRLRIDFSSGFHPAFDQRAVQAAAMTLSPGESTGGPDNRHRGADQWLFVLDGDGEALVDGERVPLSAGTLLLIERGETHRIRNCGRSALKTLNFYHPPAYDQRGEPLPAGED